MKLQNLCTKREYESNGVKKTVWLNVGRLKTLDSGQQFVELALFPNTSIYVFDIKEKANETVSIPGEEAPF